jgi:uncharacterized protein YwgA
VEERCIALKLLLDELDVPTEIASVADRKRIQKSIYLLQPAGLDLGYRFGWYLMGPYSPSLTRDYYDLAASLGEGEEDFKGMTLRRPVLQSLEKVKPLLAVPQGVPLDQASWLELVASVHYLQRVRGLDENAADDRLQAEKPELSPYTSQARRQLEATALLS